jgi:hypothetical protein
MNPYVNKYSFQRPLYLPESAWHKHSPFAFWLLSKLKPKNIVELGVHNGFSFFLFCEYAQKNKGNTLCYAVDHWIGDEHAGFFDESIYTAFIDQQQNYLEVSKVIKASFDEAVEQFDNESIDLLHIDGRHYYEDVKHDFNTWKAKLKKDAIVLFHDTHVLVNNFGVYKFWDDLKQEYPLTFEFSHGHGLGILCYGDGLSLPSVLLNLFMAPESQKEAIQMIYGSLGNQIHYEFLLKLYNVPFTND